MSAGIGFYHACGSCRTHVLSLHCLDTGTASLQSREAKERRHFHRLWRQLSNDRTPTDDTEALRQLRRRCVEATSTILEGRRKSNSTLNSYHFLPVASRAGELRLQNSSSKIYSKVWNKNSRVARCFKRRIPLSTERC